VVAQLVRRAERAGFKAIALTVDTPRLGRREADIKNRYNSPLKTCYTTFLIDMISFSLKFQPYPCN